MKFFKSFLVFIHLLFFISCGEGQNNDEDKIASNQNSDGNLNSKGDLIITEVGSRFYYDSSGWIEVYNQSSEVANLSLYKFRSRAINEEFEIVSTMTFDLPEIAIEPGSYALIQADPYGNYNTQNNVAYISPTPFIPYWDNQGFVELLFNGKSNDFVRFGENTENPRSFDAWVGTSSPELPSSYNRYGESIARNGSNEDTDSSSDFSYKTFATPMGPNDVECSEDLDQDGIPDCSELEGSTFAGINLYELGARNNQKDIFVEIDYMKSNDPGIIPHKKALQKIVDVFKEKSIYLHFDTGNLFHNGSGIDLNNFDLGGGSEVPFSKSVSFENTKNGKSVYDYKNSFMDLRRKAVFHYMLFGNSQNEDGSAGSSGIAEVDGNDSIITLGSWGFEEDTNVLINIQASTIMHELGHNLGLEHGGEDGINYKPNYLSVMNYLYQITGLPVIGSDEGDRFYYSFHFDDENCGSYNLSTILNSPFDDPDNFLIDYSNGSSSVITESNIDENKGLNRIESSSVDYNCNGSTNSSLSLDLNLDGELNDLEDHDDWSNINVFFMKRYFGESGALSPLSSSRKSEFKSVNSLQNDRQRVSNENDSNRTIFR